MQDCLQKGRFGTGSRNGNSKITERIVNEIILLLENGWTQQKIADKYGIDQSNVSLIKSKKIWASNAGWRSGQRDGLIIHRS